MGIFREADVVVIGGGITGAAILYELSKYNLNAILIEKEPDVAIGTTKANSAILHAGFDAKPGSLKAIMNARGNKLYHELKDDLNLDIDWLGSLVVATTDEQMETLKELLARGEENGIEGLTILPKEEVLRREPNLADTVRGALWAPTAGVCWPFGLTVAFAECAIQNGAEVIRECKAEGFRLVDGAIDAIETNLGTIKTRYVINAAGIYADEISRLAGDDTFTIHPRKGEYILFDKMAYRHMVRGVVFPTPSKTSKGILVCTTTHGNTFIGPNAQDGEDKDDTAVTMQGMNEIINSARQLLPTIPLGSAITEFSGLRAVSSTGDFILGHSEKTAGLIHAAGIQSPGLTSAPAIAEYLVGLIAEKENLTKKENWNGVLPKKPIFHRMSTADQAALIEKNSLYGRVICRCETITEGEIVEAIQSPCGARTVDGVKRRTRAGMGRCQGGFCGPRVTQILARELNIPVSAVRKELVNSHLFYEKNSANEEDA
ncbi:MAG: NAD(P)/FAD-dependent oxidoreductase [Selenomonadales bacterium]|nr:NAD(P)/FAD-dependent oxidoreductase [Selenomonadales bacterium]